MNAKNVKRQAVVGMVALLATVSVMTAGTLASGKERAAAAEIKTRCVKAIKTSGPWKAKLVETEIGSDGSRSVMNRDIAIKGPNQYRVTLTERDTQGHAAVSTTLRVGTTLYSRRTEADGSTVLHITKGVPPELGVMMDNTLGQMAGAVSDSIQLRRVGGDVVSGRAADKLVTEPEHYVWVDDATGLPIKEQILSNGKLNHEVTVDSIDIDEAAIPADEFDVGSLGPASRTVVEDLGFRETSNMRSARSARSALGFSPLEVELPAGYSAGVQGFIGADASAGGASYVTSFARGTRGLLVTQVHRDGLSGDVTIADDGGVGTETDGAQAVSVGGRAAVYFADRAAPRLQFAVGDVLLTVEGPVGLQEMLRVAENVH